MSGAQKVVRRLPVLPDAPCEGDVVTVVTSGCVVDLRWEDGRWRIVASLVRATR